MTQRGSGMATCNRAAAPIPRPRFTHPFSRNPAAFVPTITFMRKRRSSIVLCGRMARSCSSVEVVSTDTGNRSKNAPTGTGDDTPASAKNAEPTLASTTVSR